MSYPDSVRLEPETLLYRRGEEEDADGELILLADGQVEVPFYPEPQSQMWARANHASRGVWQLPQDIFEFSKEIASFAKPNKRERLREYYRQGYEAVETVNRLHFGMDRRTGREFKRSYVEIPYESDQTYRSATMFLEGSDPDKRHHAIVGMHGWFGRFESFAEQALPAHMREFSHLYFNRAGTDRESAGIIKEAGYSTDTHIETNIRLLERQLDHAITQKDIKTFTLCGHSMGGNVALSAMDRFWERRPDLLDRITGVTLANSTAVTNVLQDSVVDRAPGVPEVLKAGVNIFGRMMVPAAEAAKAGYRSLPSAVAERVSPYTPDKGAKLFFSGSYIENMLGHMSGPVITASRYRAEQNDGLVMAYDGLTMVNLPERQNLAKLDVPILVVEGKKDNLFSPMAAHKLAKTLIGGRPHHQVRQLVFDTGHCTQIEAPNQFNSVLFDFAQDPERYVATHGTSEEYRQAHQEQRNAFVI